MNATIEEVAPCRKRIRVELDADEVNEIFDTTLGEVSNVAQLPGFRKGRVPRRVLERRFGDAITEDVKSRLFDKGFRGTMEENELFPMGDPDVDLEALSVQRGEPFAFDLEVDVRPTFELGDVKGLPLKEYVAPVTDDEIDERLEELRYRFAEQEEVSRPAAAGDIVEGDVVITVDGEAEVDVEDRAFRLEGDTLAGFRVGDLAGLFGGVAVGDERAHAFTVADDHPADDLRGKPGEVSVSVTKVLQTNYPALDEAFAGRLGLDSLQALRDQIGQSIEADRKNEARREMEEQAVDLLIERHPFDLPEAVVERLAKDDLEQNRRRLEMYGLPPEEIAAQTEELAGRSREQAERSVRRFIIYEAIAERESLRATEADFQRHLGMLAQAYGTSPGQILKDIQQRDGMMRMEGEIRDIKVTQFLLDNAAIDSGASAAAGEGAVASSGTPFASGGEAGFGAQGIPVGPEDEAASESSAPGAGDDDAEEKPASAGTDE